MGTCEIMTCVSGGAAQAKDRVDRSCYGRSGPAREHTISPWGSSSGGDGALSMTLVPSKGMICLIVDRQGVTCQCV